jgi:hypothetical protein
MTPRVDLVVNCFERTYREVLKPGFFTNIEEQIQYPLDKIAIINNVDDRVDAEQRAEALIRTGELDAYYFVSDHIEAALEKTGLNHTDLGPLPHFLNWGIVAVCTPGNPYMVHWDADVTLEKSGNWIAPSISFMKQHPEVAIVNTNWMSPTLARETLCEEGNFALGYGFSDQLFLARRAELSRPIYKHFCPASVRYPLANIGSTFERRIDAYMRSQHRLRATYKPLRYIHPDNEGVSYPSYTLTQRLRHRRNKLLIKLLRISRSKNPCWKL